MDLDVADSSMGSLLRRAGTAASPLSDPSSASPRRRRRRSGQTRRDSLAVRASLLRRAAAGQQRAPAASAMEQFVRDQELAFDASTDSLDWSASGSPTARARSFLAHQRRSLSGDELATLLRELRTPASRTGSRRLSVGVSRRQLTALGDDGMQALLELMDDGLAEFDGTMSASVEGDETLTPTPSPEPAGGDADVTVTEMGAGSGLADEDEEAKRSDQTAGTAGQRDSEQAEAMELGGKEEQLPAVENADEQETSSAVDDTNRSSTYRSPLRRSSRRVSVQTPEAWDSSGAPTSHVSIHQSLSSGGRRGTPSAGGGTTSSVGRRSRLSQSLPIPASPEKDAPSHQTPPPVQEHSAMTAATPAVPAKDTPASKAPLRSVTPRSAYSRRASTSVGRSGGGGTALRNPPADSTPVSKSPVLRRKSGQAFTPRRQAAAAGPTPEDVQAAGDVAQVHGDLYDADAAFDTPLRHSRSPVALTSSSIRSRSSLATAQSKATPRGGSARKQGASAFERLLAGDRQTSTPMSEPLRRTVGAARSAAHSRSLFATAPLSQGRVRHRLSLAGDEYKRPAQPFTSGLIDDPDQDSDVSEEFPSETAAAGSPQLRSPAGGRVSQLSGGSRAAGTPFVPSAESTRLSVRSAGALAPQEPVSRDADTPTAFGTPSGSLAAGTSAASAHSAARQRSTGAPLSDRKTPAQGRPSSAALASLTQKSGSSRPATAGKLNAKEAFARLFPNFERDQETKRAEAADKRRRSKVRVTKRRSLFGSHGTRAWFRRNAVGLRVTSEALDEVDVSVAKFERMVTGWLDEVTGRNRAASLTDVLAVLRRSGMATTEAQLRQLVRQHMTLEQQQELIRVAECGGRLYPAENPLAE